MPVDIDLELLRNKLGDLVLEALVAQSKAKANAIALAKVTHQGNGTQPAAVPAAQTQEN